ncbi:hypothetical protein ACE6H2_023068 [Prunus campanulata]
MRSNRLPPLDKEELKTFFSNVVPFGNHSKDQMWHNLDLYFKKLDQDYWHRLKEDGSNAARRGDSLAILRADVKMQVKFVSSLKKKSLWSKTFEEVEKLVDIVHFLHLGLHEAFGSADDEPVESSWRNHKKLGPSGISLQYASIITQINTLVSFIHYLTLL